MTARLRIGRQPSLINTSRSHRLGRYPTRYAAGSSSLLHRRGDQDGSRAPHHGLTRRRRVPKDSDHAYHWGVRAEQLGLGPRPGQGEYERSGGTRANTLLDTGMPVIIVTTHGNKSGKVRKMALMHVEHGGRYALVASMGQS